ncbi:MAG TPA: GNAT family N-acetyltransferase [Acidimicrobiales bacterium]|nr:GNAT family N-acetyltransferase [Acidimicrobiales bacterium]
MTFAIRPMDAADRERVATIAAQSFHLNAPTARAVEWYKPEQWVVVEDRGGVQAALQVLDAGQYFGGAAVPVAHVHALMVSAEARSRGYGKALLRHGVDEMRTRGMPLSVLIASVSDVYRRSGYEYAGSRVRYRVAVDALPADDPGLAVEPFSDEDVDEVAACYERVARHHNGPTARPRWWWSERVLRRHKRELLHRYLVRDEHGEVRGYLVYTQETQHGRFAPEFVTDDIGYPYRIVARDFLWETLDAAKAFLAFVARHMAMATEFVWLGPVDEPLALLVPKRDLAVENRAPWMARIVDVGAALTTRGYPPWANGAIDLRVDDPLREESTSIRFEVTDGKPAVGPGFSSKAVVRTDVGALAAMFTSWLAPREAARLGRVTGASAAEIETLEQLFGGRSPWALDLF